MDGNAGDTAGASHSPQPWEVLTEVNVSHCQGWLNARDRLRLTDDAARAHGGDRICRGLQETGYDVIGGAFGSVCAAAVLEDLYLAAA